MSVKVYRTRRDNAAAGVQLLGSGRVYSAADHGHPAISDANVRTDPREARAVYNNSSANHQIKFGHKEAS
jgi:hypothetical protein